MFRKVFLGLGATAGLWAALVVVASSVGLMLLSPHTPPNLTPIAVGIVAVLLFLVWHFGVVVYFILKVLTGNEVEETKRLPWLVGFLLASPIAAIAYWYHYVYQNGHPIANR